MNRIFNNVRSEITRTYVAVAENVACTPKWSPDKRVKAPADWTSAYPDASFTIATRDNWQGLLEANQPLIATPSAGQHT